MSLKVMTWVFYESRATGIDKLILLAIADHAHDDGASAYPGLELLAKKAGVSEATVSRSIRRLEGLGELGIEKGERVGRGAKFSYTVQMVAERKDTSSAGPKVAQRNHPAGKGCTAEPEKVAETASPIEEEPYLLEPKEPPPAAADVLAERVTSRDLLAEHIDALGYEPATKGRLASVTKRLLDRQHIPPDTIRAALTRMRERGLTSPSVLEGMVDDVQGGKTPKNGERPARYSLNGDTVTPPTELLAWARRGDADARALEAGA